MISTCSQESGLGTSGTMSALGTENFTENSGAAAEKKHDIMFEKMTIHND